MNVLISFETLILTVHVIVCLFLILVILVQAGKGADIGATFGAGSSQTLFGARGAATFLSKITTIAAVIFLLTSGSLAYIHKNRQSQADSVIKVEQKTPSDKQTPSSEKEPAQTKDAK